MKKYCLQSSKWSSNFARWGKHVLSRPPQFIIFLKCRLSNPPLEGASIPMDDNKNLNWDPGDGNKGVLCPGEIMKTTSEAFEAKMNWYSSSLNSIQEDGDIRPEAASSGKIINGSDLAGAQMNSTIEDSGLTGAHLKSKQKATKGGAPGQGGPKGNPGPNVASTASVTTLTVTSALKGILGPNVKKAVDDMNMIPAPKAPLPAVSSCWANEVEIKEVSKGIPAPSSSSNPSPSPIQESLRARPEIQDSHSVVRPVLQNSLTSAMSVTTPGSDPKPTHQD